MKLLSKFNSLIFHPILIPIYMLFIVFYIPSLGIRMMNNSFRLVIIGLLIVNNLLIPIISFYFMQKQGIIQSLHMKTAAERKVPYLLLFSLYAVTSFLLMRASYIDPIIIFIPMAAACTILVLIPINHYLKISAHMASIGSAIAYLFLLHFYFEYNLIILIVFTVLAAGFIGSSRLYLKAHNTQEIYSGFFTGLLITLFIGSLYLF